jgi:hypothetical protein
MNLFDDLFGPQICGPDDITDFSTRTISGTTRHATGGRGSVTLPEFLAREEKICDEIREQCEQQRVAWKLEQGEQK